MGNIFEFSDRKYEKGLEAKHTGKHKETLEAPDQIPVPEDHINENLYEEFEGYTEKMDAETKDKLMEDQNFLKSVARTKRDFRELFQAYPSVKRMVSSRRDGDWVLQKVIMDLCFHNADRVLTRRAEGKPESTGKNPYLFGLSHYEKARILATRFKQYDAEKAAEKARQEEGAKVAPAEETEVEKLAKKRKKAIVDRVKELTGKDVGELGPEFKFELGGVTFRPQSDSALPNGLIITDEGWGSVGPDHLFWVTGEYDGQTMSFGFKVGDPTDLVEFNKVTEQSEDFGASDKGDLEKWIEGRKINIRKEGVRKKFNTVFGKNVVDMNEGRLEIGGLTFTPSDGNGAIKSPNIWLSDGASYRFHSNEYKGVKLELAISVLPPNLFSVSNGPNFSPLGTDTEAEVNAWVEREKARIDAEQRAKIENAKKPPAQESVPEATGDVIAVRNEYVDAQDDLVGSYNKALDRVKAYSDPGAANDRFLKLLEAIDADKVGGAYFTFNVGLGTEGARKPDFRFPKFEAEVAKWPAEKLRAATEAAKAVKSRIDQGVDEMFEGLEKEAKLQAGLDKLTPKKPEGQIFERREVSRAVNRMIMQYVLAEAEKDLNAFNTSVSNDSVFLHLDNGRYLRLTVHRKPVAGGVNIYFSFGENPNSPDFLIQPYEIVEKRGEETIKLNFTDRHMKSRYVKAVEGVFEAKMSAVISKVEAGKLDPESVLWKPQAK